MDKCPTCGNSKVKKRYIVGANYEEGKVYCDACVTKKNKIKAVWAIPRKEKDNRGVKKNG